MEENNDYIKMFNINELNRLQRCAKNKDKKELIKWGQEFEERLSKKYEDINIKKYKIWLEETFKDLDIALIYTLHFNECTKFGNKRIKSVMDDVGATMKSLYKGEFKRKDFRQMLKDDGINILED